jgi:beta-glucanase (GH16 family)
VPDAPASLGAPTSVVFSDNFDTGSLDTSVWAPEWFKDGSTANNTVMDSSNVSVGPNGLDLQLASNGTGGLVSSNPDDGVAGHTGFQIAPSPGKPVYVEFQATLPGASGHVANWPALWLDGQTWPEDGEIDVMEGLGGYTAYHIHYGSTGEGSQGPGSAVNDSAGTHTFGVLWTTTSITFVYDGNVVGSLSESLTSPMYLVLENSFSSADPLLPATMDVRYVRVWQ